MLIHVLWGIWPTISLPWLRHCLICWKMWCDPSTRCCRYPKHLIHHLFCSSSKKKKCWTHFCSYIFSFYIIKWHLIVYIYVTRTQFIHFWNVMIMCWSINNALKFTFRKIILLYSVQKVDICRMYFTETPVYFPSAMYVIYSEFCCLQRFLLVNSMNK